MGIDEYALWQMNACSHSLPRRLNNAFQPTRYATLAPQDRRHFKRTTDLSKPYPRSERLNPGRSAFLYLSSVRTGW